MVEFWGRYYFNGIQMVTSDHFNIRGNYSFKRNFGSELLWLRKMCGSREKKNTTFRRHSCIGSDQKTLIASLPSNGFHGLWVSTHFRLREVSTFQSPRVQQSLLWSIVQRKKGPQTGRSPVPRFFVLTQSLQHCNKTASCSSVLRPVFPYLPGITAGSAWQFQQRQ